MCVCGACVGRGGVDRGCMSSILMTATHFVCVYLCCLCAVTGNEAGQLVYSVQYTTDDADSEGPVCDC